ncbi:MAG: RNA polymerase sigma factor [Bacteroidetes bacterium]|nr:MAG: RNA polymerase sigma factor [Bacteroidota bacterium]
MGKVVSGFCASRAKVMPFSPVVVEQGGFCRKAEKKNKATHATPARGTLPEGTNRPNNHTEHEGMDSLIEACKTGDRKAQRQLFERYKDKMFALCLRYAPSRPDAEDMLQEGFVKVFRDLPAYRGEGSLEGWIRKIMTRTAIDWLKRNRRQQMRMEDVDDHLWHLADSAGEVDEAGPPARTLIRLMQQLPDGFRAVLNLHVIEGYSHPEIADILGISVGTSKSQLSRAKAALRQMWEKSLTR